MNRLIVFVAVLCLLTSSCFASIVNFKLTVKDGASTTLGVGDQRTIQVWAEAEGAVAGSGIVNWNTDLQVSGTGVVTAVSFQIYQPNPYDTSLAFEPWLNSDGSGTVSWLGAVVSNGSQSSDAGVGYSLMAEVVIEGVSEGSVDYSIGDYFGSGFNAGLKGVAEPLAGNFETGLSDYQFTVGVMPEPSTIAILSGLSIMAFRKRNRR